MFGSIRDEKDVALHLETFGFKPVEGGFGRSGVPKKPAVGVGPCAPAELDQSLVIGVGADDGVRNGIAFVVQDDATEDAAGSELNSESVGGGRQVDGRG